MGHFFTDEARFAAWLEVEVLAVEAWAAIGVIPTEHATAVRQGVPAVTPDLVARINERERVTDHDVAAFVDVVQEAIGAARRPLGALRADVVRRRRHRPVC